MRRLWRDYLTIVAAGLFLASFLAWALVAWKDYKSEAHRHGTSADFDAFLSRFWAFTLENWQSEFLHVLVFVVLTALFIQKGSAESRDSDDRMEAALERIEEHLQVDGRGRTEATLARIEERLDALERRQEPPPEVLPGEAR